MRVIPSSTNLGILCKRNEAINGTLHSTFPWPSQVGSQFLFIYFLTESTKDWYNVSYAEYHSCHTWVVAKLRVIPFDFDLIQGMLGLVGHKGQSLLGRCPATWLFLLFLSDNSIFFSYWQSLSYAFGSWWSSSIVFRLLQLGICGSETFGRLEAWGRPDSSQVRESHIRHDWDNGLWENSLG